MVAGRLLVCVLLFANCSNSSAEPAAVPDARMSPRADARAPADAPLMPDQALARADGPPSTAPDLGPADFAARDFAASDLAPPDLARDTSPDDAAADAPPGVTYNPCPPRGQPCVALPLGDSLTQGAGSSGGGYRRELFRQVVRNGQSVTFVGSARSGPAMLDGVPAPFPRAHEGHGGFTIQGIATWITQNATISTYKPDIVMLEIGTNNGLRRAGANVPAALEALGALIDQILAADDHLLLIVAQITPNKTDLGISQIQAFNRGIPALVAARAAKGKHIAIVDIYKYFVANPNWKADYLPSNDVHPVDAGYDAMGRGWYSALGPLLR
jgi:lysophospholipase L1-like esterase